MCKRHGVPRSTVDDLERVVGKDVEVHSNVGVEEPALLHSGGDVDIWQVELLFEAPGHPVLPVCERHILFTECVE